ncbi:sterol esterase [Mycena albidolilacea]|uniref:Sterol esterase n=1 Tax=Mycena albidolilacea TaxID=1033008 RepID=A0AAD7EEY0_9AGAR|nr:sterol esterase [Mycena albidolilacea]
MSVANFVLHGSVRFTLPKASKALHSVQNATTFSPACSQQALTPPSPIPPFVVPVMSENCQKLNVFVPSSAGFHSKLPVLVWFYGGWVDDKYHSAWGFLGSKEVIDAGITNLRMRTEHIAAFGGDPSRVVSGHGGVSAGAISSALLLLSNKRFDAFMLPGSPVNTGSVREAQPYYDELVAANNCTGSKNALDCLRHIPLDAFKASVDKTPNLFSFSALQNVWHPRIDGDIMVYNPLVSVSKGLYAKIPIMTGDSDYEGTTNDEFLGYLRSKFVSQSSFPKSAPAEVAELLTLYPEDPTHGSPFDTGLANEITPEFKRIAAFQGDFTFTGARRFFLEHASRTQSAWSWLNFINNLDPNDCTRGRTTSGVFWPKWNDPSANGSTSLLTLSDPSVVSITAENFRVDAIKYLFGLLLKEAE